MDKNMYSIYNNYGLKIINTLELDINVHILIKILLDLPDQQQKLLDMLLIK